MSTEPAPQLAPVDAGAPPPIHVAFIMDGNRRWARSRGMPSVFGHQEGAKAVRRVVESLRDLGIHYVTFYAFSSENWNRSADEIGDLMNLLRFYLRRELNTLRRNDIRLRFIGDLSQLPDDIRVLAEDALATTRGNAGPVMTFALNYGSRQEIARVARQLAEDVAAGRLGADDITPNRFGRALTDGIPDPDLLVRTSGEQRLSNFLLWELAYAEFVFTPVHWPEFSAEHLRAALDEFAKRERRYGASGA
ncbi:MAG: polyprenyl diphosphate synthase [Pseudomonadota bacterium]